MYINIILYYKNIIDSTNFNVVFKLFSHEFNGTYYNMTDHYTSLNLVDQH